MGWAAAMEVLRYVRHNQAMAAPVVRRDGQGVGKVLGSDADGVPVMGG